MLAFFIQCNFSSFQSHFIANFSIDFWCNKKKNISDLDFKCWRTTNDKHTARLHCGFMLLLRPARTIGGTCERLFPERFRRCSTIFLLLSAALTWRDFQSRLNIFIITLILTNKDDACSLESDTPAKETLSTLVKAVNNPASTPNRLFLLLVTRSGLGFNVF